MRGPLGTGEGLEGLPLWTSLRCCPRVRGPSFPPKKRPGGPACPPGCALGDGAFSLPALGPHDCIHGVCRGAKVASPFPRTRSPPFCRDSNEIWGTLPCPPSTPCLASPPSSLTIAPGSPARVFLLPVAPNQLRLRTRDVGGGLPRAGAGSPNTGAETGRLSRSCHGAKWQRRFCVSPETFSRR